MQGAPWGDFVVKPMLIGGVISLAVGFALATCVHSSQPAAKPQVVVDTLAWDAILEGEPAGLIDRLYAAADEELRKRCSNGFYPTKESARIELNKFPSRRGQMCGAYYGCTAINTTVDGQTVEWDCLNGTRPENLYEPDPVKLKAYAEKNCRADVRKGKWKGFGDPMEACLDEMGGTCPWPICLPDSVKGKS